MLSLVLLGARFREFVKLLIVRLRRLQCRDYGIRIPRSRFWQRLLYWGRS
jgi:hypothetical protein